MDLTHINAMTDLLIRSEGIAKFDIPILKDVNVNVGFGADIKADDCKIGPPDDHVLLTAYVTPPGEAESPFLSINVREVFHGTDCRGNHAANKSGNPLRAKKGTYTLRFETKVGNVADRLKLVSVQTTASIRVIASGATVVDASYAATPIPEGGVSERKVNDTWAFDCEQ